MRPRRGLAGLLALALAACGHAGGSAGEPLAGLPTADLPVQLPVAPVPAADGRPSPVSDVEVVTLAADGVARFARRAVKDGAEVTTWERVSLRGPDFDSRRPLSAGLRRSGERGRVPLVIDADAPWWQVVSLLDRALPRSGDRSADVLFAVGDTDVLGRRSWLSIEVRRTFDGPFRGEAGLGVTLERTEQEARTRIEALGAAWIAASGCDQAWVERIEGWGGWAQAAWELQLDAVVRVAQTSEVTVRVKAAETARMRDVLPFLAAARERGILRMDLGVHTYRKRFTDPVDDALRWLAAHQLPDGRWDEALAPEICDGKALDGGLLPRLGADTDPGLTGRALCAFLGAGYTNRGRHPFAKVVSRGLRHLKKVQRPDGAFDETPSGHAWAALAMLEAYARTGSPIFKGAALRGLAWLPESYRNGRGDAVARVLTAVALRSAQLTNEEARKRGKPPPLGLPDGLAAELQRDGEALSPEPGDRRAAAGLFTRLLLGGVAPGDPGLLTGADACVAALADERTAVDPLHAWLTTAVAWRVGASTWKRLQQALKARVSGRQHAEGHVCCRRGSWDPPPGAHAEGGRVAATALSTLCFEFYYRYDRVVGSR